MARIEEQRIDGLGMGKTIFFPPMEPFGARLLAAAMRSAGFGARVLAEDHESLALGLKYTGGGECVPCPATAGALLKVMRDEKLNPQDVIFFMPTACGPCRLGQYAKLDSMIFGKLGWESLKIMSPSAENAYEGIEDGVRMRMWHGIIVSDVMRKMGERARPYEKNRGEVDAALSARVDEMEKIFERTDISAAAACVAKAASEIRKLMKDGPRKPLVGVVGEIYVRSDPFMNNSVCRRIEELGGESWLAPVGEWILYTNHLRNLILREQGRGIKAMLERARTWLETNFFFEKWEHHYYRAAAELLSDRIEPPVIEVMERGMRYLPWQFEGEALLTLGRAEMFVQRDGARAIVNASPMFCMPGTITTSIFPALEKKLGVPVVCNFYDGSGDPNQSLVPVMHYLREKWAAEIGAASA